METAKTFKRIGTIVGIEVKRKTQRGILGKLFGKWYDKQVDTWVREMPRIQFKSIKVNQPFGETYYL